MWWLLGLLWIIAVVIVIFFIRGSKDFDYQFYLGGYHSAMESYFNYGVSIQDLFQWIANDITDKTVDEDTQGVHDAIITLIEHGFPEEYDGVYLP